MSQNSKFYSLILLFLVAEISISQQKTEVLKILGISVDGQRTADPAAIVANTGLKIGDELSPQGDQTKIAIDRLYGLRLFEDIQLLIENRTPQGIYLLIRVKENPRLDTIEVVGNDELSTEDIEKKINLIRGQLVTKQDLSTIKRILRQKYDEDGFLNAVIEPRLVPTIDTTHRRVKLVIQLDEGQKVKIDKIRFFGNKTFEDSDLKGEMKETNERVWWQFWSTNKFDKKKYEEDKQLLLNFYRKNGYRDADIIADSIHIDETKHFLNIDLYVYEGPQYKVRNIIWDGNSIYKVDALNARLGMNPGEVYDAEKFEKNLRRNEDENDVTSLYMNEGYLMFQVVPEEMRVGVDSLDLVLHIREGNQFRIGRVLVTGNTKTYEKVIRRELFTRPGDFFSRQAIIRSARQLSQLNYFNPEKIRPDVRETNEKKGTVDLEYAVEEKSSDTFNMSVGYSGYWGFNGGVGLAFNNFSLSEPFRGGAGQVLTFDWQFGEGYRYRTFSIGFQEPWMLDTPTLFGVNVFDTRQVFGWDLRVTGASLRVGRRFRWPDIFFRGDWTLRFQRSDVVNGGGYYPEGRTTQFTIGQSISRNSTDSPIFPTQGSNVSLLTEISGGPTILGYPSSKYHKHVFTADWYIPLFGTQRLAFATNNMVGLIFEYGKNTSLPYQELFYMGGTGLGYFNTTPLRGYEDRSVGPNNGYNGGKAILKYNAELRFALSIHPIPIYMSAFAEAGNVWLDPKYMDPYDLKRSAGVGVRLLINPIGLIGFDYGYGFDGQKIGVAGPGWKFHLQFGRGF
ncbi:MAG: outer membrane protein assembly factor BamA [bacterium]